MSRSVATVVPFLALVLSASVPAAADDLPPKEAPAYSAVYQVTRQRRPTSNDEWAPEPSDTVDIAVLHKQARWDFKGDGHTELIDSVDNTTTTFGGRVAPNTAVRGRAPYKAIGWEFGYATIASATERPAEVLGTDTIAGQPCTRLKLRSVQYGQPEFCVAKSGIVLRFATQSATANVTYEAQSVNATAPDPDRLKVPAGYTVQERAKRRRQLRFD